MRIVAQWVILIFIAMGTAGCGKQDSNAPAVDLSQLEKLFAKASEEEREIVGRAVEFVRQPDYVKALAELEKLNDRGDLDPRQQIALKTAIIRVQDAITRESTTGSSSGTTNAN